MYYYILPQNPCVWLRYGKKKTFRVKRKIQDSVKELIMRLISTTNRTEQFGSIFKIMIEHDLNFFFFITIISDFSASSEAFERLFS